MCFGCWGFWPFWGMGIGGFFFPMMMLIVWLLFIAIGIGIVVYVIKRIDLSSNDRKRYEELKKKIEELEKKLESSSH
ncbi:MAG: hypothetical protein QXT69_06000 [Fervidicoccaceae archaeon]